MVARLQSVLVCVCYVYVVRVHYENEMRISKYSLNLFSRDKVSKWVRWSERFVFILFAFVRCFFFSFLFVHSLYSSIPACLFCHSFPFFSSRKHAIASTNTENIHWLSFFRNKKSSWHFAKMEFEKRFHTH